MTAEIAIMNLEAVALAADSAVTAYHGGNRKISTSQNKLFALSDVAPVGALVYGNASFMSIPWETLIKEYRRKSGSKTFGHLHDYIEDFCQFLIQHIRGYIGAEHQAGFMVSLISYVFSEIEQQIQMKVSQEIASNLPKASPSQDFFETIIGNATMEVIKGYHDRACEAPLIEGMNEELVAEARRSLEGDLEDIRRRFFSDDINSEAIQMLNDIADKTMGAMLADILQDPTGPSTGIVVAGFGEDDLFPAYSEVLVEGLTGNVLRMRGGHTGKLGPENTAVIVPFAQREVVDEFMRGMAPDYYDYLYTSMISHLDEYTAIILENLDRYSEDEKVAIRDALQDNCPDIADAFIEQIESVGRDLLAGPIVDVVSTLPKDSLAEMAEALVSLTSLKRRVTPEEETVGGPTDVAVITKADGLIWIRRKHYFSADLNPRYMARINRGGYGHATESA